MVDVERLVAADDGRIAVRVLADASRVHVAMPWPRPRCSRRVVMRPVRTPCMRPTRSSTGRAALSVDGRARQRRVEARAEERLGAVDVADARDDVLVHEAQADRGPRAVRSVDEALRVGVVADRVGTEPRDDAGRSASMTSAHAVGPVRSATACSPRIRTRTWPRGARGARTGPRRRPALRRPARPAATSRSPTRLRGAPIACTTATEPSPANVHDPYRPRWTRSHSDSASATFPGATPRGAKPRTSACRRPGRARARADRAPRRTGGETALRARHRDVRYRRSWNVRANRWTVCPPGTRHPPGGCGAISAGLVRRELVDATLVTLVAAERLGEERVDERRRLLGSAGAHRSRRRSRRCAGGPELRRLDAPGERGADAKHLVRGDLLAVPRAADDDAERTRLSRDGLSGREAEGRIVVLGVVLERAVVRGPWHRGVIRWVLRANPAWSETM